MINPHQGLFQYKLRLRKDKCVFLAPSVVYLGHRIDEQGLHPVAEKLQALQEAPRPTNVSELKSYFGLLTYYAVLTQSVNRTCTPVQTVEASGGIEMVNRAAEGF